MTGAAPDVPWVWREALRHAEQARPDRITDRERAAVAARLLSQSEALLAHPDLGRAFARLVPRLDALGLRAASHALLEQVVSRLAWDARRLRDDLDSLNHLAVVLADRGHLPAASTVLGTAVELGARQDTGLAAARTFANLAATRIRLGDHRGAAEAAAEALHRAPEDDGDTVDHLELRLLVTCVLAAAARMQDRHGDADRLVDDIELTVRRLVAVVGGQHPAALSALVALASAEFESARAADDRDRMERAADVLAIAAQKTAATAGALHPQAVAALVSLAAAEGDTAVRSGDGRRLRAAGRLAATARRRAEIAARGPAARPRPGGRSAAPPLPAPATTSAPVRRRPASAPAPPQQFKVLGPVRLYRYGEEASAGSPQQRALLAVLLLRSGRTATAAELIDSVWGEDPPSQALAALRTYASRLRKVLSPGVLVSESGGYAIAVAPGSLDLEQAQHLAAEADRCRTDGKSARARMLLDKALALWDGEALAGVPGPFAEAHRARLEAWRLELREARLGLDLELGAHAEAVSELTSLTGAHPLRERLRELLMLALYRSGRQAEALAVYADTRRFLAEELGVEPGPALRELQQRILRADPELGGAADGPEAPYRAALVRPAQLPATVPDFTGRTALVDELVTLLTTEPGFLTAISGAAGIGGIGKTTLAVHVAHAARSAFPDGQLYADLQGVGPRAAEPETVLGSFLRALGTPDAQIPDSLHDRAALYRSMLDRRRVLVLLDNARDSAQVRPLLPAAPGCATLITSRVRMVDLAGAHLVDLDVLSPDEAVQFFTGIVGEERVAAEREAALDVVSACGFLPLAIRIAASRLAARRTWTVAVLAAKLADERRRLDELQAGDLAVRSSFELGYGQLEPHQARAFRLIGLADGPDISLAAAAAMLDGPPEETEDQLEALVDTGFLESAAPGRYRFHDLTRLYARACAEREAPEERDAALTRLLDFYLASAAEAYAVEHPGDRSVEHLAPTSRAAAEFSYLEDARRWLGAETEGILSCARQLAHGARLRRAIDLLWSVKDTVGVRSPRLYHETAAAAKRAAHAARDAQAEGRACAALTAVHLTAGDLRAADAEAQRALVLALAVDDPVTGAWVQYDRGVIALQEGRFPEADRCLREALSRFRADDNPFGVASALCQLSHVEAGVGNVRSAVALAEEAIERIGSEAATLALAESRYALGIALSATGRTGEALSQLDQALVIFEDCGQALGEGMVRFRRAQIQLALRAPGRAAAEAEQALAVLSRVGGDRRRADVLVVLGDAMAGQGESARARTCWAEALAVYERVRGPEGEELCRPLRERLHRAGRTAGEGAGRAAGS
ncbi:BTAD domain-containing putative transcriptional regulator [Streptomyces tricolor]|uniref:BTAD domain-containing putative transcriptional regulator n=1 Tax=Streptomyces tricolor TaxID=68277 RepID=UPI0037F18420